MNVAKHLLRQWTNCADHPDADLKLAAKQTHDMAWSIRKTHVPKQTKRTRRVSSILSPRLFKGHRI